MRVLICAALFLSVGLAFGEGIHLPVTRKLTDFGDVDGKDNKVDDTAVIREALAVGPGVVQIGPGFYRWGDVTVPKGVTVVGCGKATVIRSNGAKAVFLQKGVSEWSIRELVLDGQAKGDWKTRKDLGQAGILSDGCSGYDVIGVTARNFNGAGIQLMRTGAWHSRGNLDRITATGNYVGVRFAVGGEYINATKFSCQQNVVGCIIHAGNVKIAASSFTSNLDGVVIKDKANGSHGALSNCLINHNERYALLAEGAKNGMAIDNCCFFYGTILVKDSVGVNITSGIISCTVKVVGEAANRIAGNYVIPMNFTFEFAPLTIVQDNFTEKGKWERNLSN